MLLTQDQASAFAKLPLRCVRQEYPNSLGHVINDPNDIRGPRELHPAFYGCFDWHSSVHGHWMLVRLLKRFTLPEAAEIRRVLGENLSAENLQAEAAYFEQPNRKSFERTYGWAWLLKLAEEMRDSDDPDICHWSENLKPLETVIVDRYLTFLPKQTYPIRTGLHPNTAFGLAFAHDYAMATHREALRSLAAERAATWFGRDANYPANLEPSGADFFSPCLMEGDLMRRVLPVNEFLVWFEQFLPNLASDACLLTPATVGDRTDPQIAHLDGLNLSRAWCMRNIASALPEGATKQLLTLSAEGHMEAGLAGVQSGDYAGEHWLASFAVYLLT